MSVSAGGHPIERIWGYAVLLRPDGVGADRATCPALPEASVSGGSPEEARRLIEEAIVEALAWRDGSGPPFP